MAPQASRRFHEAGVGSRTGLRLSAVARDQDGFEDLEAFYKASQAALDHGQQTEDDQDNSEDDYDSFDQTRFGRRKSSSGVNGRNRHAASSSSTMDIQNSSAPSPRSLLRSSQPSAVSTNSPGRKARTQPANITLADDDDDLGLPNLSTSSKSFDLGALGGDSDEDEEQLRNMLPTPSAPARGLSARQARAGRSVPKEKGKGKVKAAPTTCWIELSDLEDDEILANTRQRLGSAHDDDQHMDALSDFEAIPARPSHSKSKGSASAARPESPAKPAAKKRAVPADKEPAQISQPSRSMPTVSTSQAAQSQKRKPGRPPKTRPVEQEPEPVISDESELNSLPPQGSQKRKPGRPPKTRPVEQEPEPVISDESELNSLPPQGLQKRKPGRPPKTRPVEQEPEPVISDESELNSLPPQGSQKRKPGQPPKTRPVEQELEPVISDESESDYLPPRAQLESETAQPSKRKRGIPQKNRAAQERGNGDIERGAAPSRSTINGVGQAASSSAKAKASKASSSSKSKRAAGEVVEKVHSQPHTATVYDKDGVRRSTRQRFAPLEYWRGERIRYGRPSLPSGTHIDDTHRSRRPGEEEFEDDPSMMHVRKRVPVLDIKEVIRVPRAPGEGTFAGTGRPRANRHKVDRKSEDRVTRPTSRTPDPDDGWFQLDPTADTVHVEDGWDAKTIETGLVIDDEEGAEIETNVVRTKKSLRPVAAAGQQFRFEKLFKHGGLMATGVLQLPPGTRKPTKSSQDNNFVFCVLQGALRATVHRKQFMVGPEGIFQVPSGNTYSLENICQRDVHLFFAQCRKTKKASAGDLTTFTQISDTSYATPRLGSSRPVLDEIGGRYAAADVRVERQEQPSESEQEEEENEAEQERAVAAKRPRNSKVPPSKVKEKASAASAASAAPLLTADSDQDDDEDDFETSRRMKSKKLVFRRV